MATSYRSLEAGMLVAGEYRILRLLGEGGMGAVYLAEQMSTGANRALKVMLGELARSATFRKRFAQEARASARIPSDHVVQVIAAGVDEALELPWIAMELLEGGTLDAKIDEEGPLSLHETMDLFGGLCHGLGAAHAMGIVHRDLKPQNIFLAMSRRRGEHYTPKLVDFGIAKLTAEAQTQATGAMGTPMWMAPEQTVTGSEIGPQTDVWSLALLVFYTLTGLRYWVSAHDEDASVVALLRELTMEPIESASARAARLGASELIPAGFDAWFLRCLSRDAKERYPDARIAFAELQVALGISVTPSFLGPPKALVSPSENMPVAATFESTHVVAGTEDSAFKKLAGAPFGQSLGDISPPPLVGSLVTPPKPFGDGIAQPPIVTSKASPWPQRTSPEESGAKGRTLVLSTPPGTSAETAIGPIPGAPPPAPAATKRASSDRPTAEQTTRSAFAAEPSARPQKGPRTAWVAAAVLAIGGVGAWALWSKFGGTGGGGSTTAAQPSSIASGAASAAVAATTPIRVCGTSIVESAFQSWATSFGRKSSAAPMKFENMGSGPALAALLDGTVDMAITSRPANAEETARGKVAGFDLQSPQSEHILALDALAITVHPSNPATQVSLRELRDLFTGKTRDWTTLGQGTGAIELILRPEEFGEHQSFTSLVFRPGDKYMSGAEVVRAGKDLQVRIARSPHAVSYMSFSLVGSNKALKVGARTGGVYFAPSTTTIRDRSYPLVRPLYLYTRGAPSGVLADFVKHVQDHSESVLSSVGLVGPRIPIVDDPSRAPKVASICKGHVGRKRASVDLRFRDGLTKLDELGEADLRMIAKALCSQGATEIDVVESGPGATGSPTDRAKWVASRLTALCPQVRPGCVVEDPTTSPAPRTGRSVEVWARSEP